MLIDMIHRSASVANRTTTNQEPISCNPAHSKQLETGSWGSTHFHSQVYCPLDIQHFTQCFIA